MKKLMSKFEDIMSAVTFAEAGEHETARQIMKEGESRSKKYSAKCPHCGEKITVDSMPEPHKA